MPDGAGRARTRKSIPTDHLAEVHEKEALVDEVEATRDRLRDSARRRLGVTGESGNARPFREILGEYGVGVYPLAALGVLSIVDTFQTYAFSVLTPEISAALGIGRGAVAGILAIKTLAAAVAPLPFAALVQRRARRAILCIATGVLWSIFAMATGFATAVWGLLFVLVIDGMTTASVGVLHAPLLLDSYPPPARVRVLSYYQGANSFGNVVAPLLVALFATQLHLTWRGVFVALGLISLGAALTSVRLRDPGFGHWDTDEIRDSVRTASSGSEDGPRAARPAPDAGAARDAVSDVSLGFFEVVRRLLLIPTIARLLMAYTVYGILLIPYTAFLSFFLDERWGLGPGGRGLFSAFVAAIAIVALAASARGGQRAFRPFPRDAGWMVRLPALPLSLAIFLGEAPFAGPHSLPGPFRWSPCCSRCWPWRCPGESCGGSGRGGAATGALPGGGGGAAGVAGVWKVCSGSVPSFGSGGAGPFTLPGPGGIPWPERGAAVTA